ncbi:L-type lectin-domain containing receptor kinase IX.1 [Bienertia sinuspersici]
MPKSPKILQNFLQLYTIIIIIIISLLQQRIITSSSSASSTCDEDKQVILSFPTFNPSNCKHGGELLCMGAVTPGEGFLNLTTAATSANTESSEYMTSGRILYRFPVQIWPASFCTSFSFRIFPRYNQLNFSGDGITFVMDRDNKFTPNQSNTTFNQLAIEMDTFKNEWDPDGNHIAIDTQSSMKSLIAKPLNSSHIDLKSEKQIRLKIQYDGWTKVLQIYVGYEGNPLTSFLNYSIKLSQTIPKHVYIGFTASTGLLTETHQLLDWVFTSKILPYKSLKDNKRRDTILVSVVVPILGCLFILAMIGGPIFRRRMIRKKERSRRIQELERQSAAAASTPRKFTYKQLAKATKNFSKDNLLGTGGFGSVYKGHIVEPPQTIAVKKISATSQQGEREYLAEICTIGRLRHKNILQLQGWSHENEQLLLVYDFMPKMSLNGYITGENFLDWTKRCKILTGLASALFGS